MGVNDFWINNNGKKEHLNNAKHGVRKEQVDKKFHNLFDAYDANGDGTLETEELGGVFKGLTKFAGADKTLDSAENKQVATLFANQAGIQDADFIGFVRSVSKATEDIVDSKTTPTADGGREVTTTYKDGSVETISYYPDGEYKFKKLDQKATTTTNFYTVGDNLNKKYTAAEIEGRVKKAYQQKVAQIKASAEKNKPVEGRAIAIIPVYNQFKQEYMQRNRINQGSDTRNFERHDFELSERGKQDVAVRDFVLSHYVETHQAAKEALDTLDMWGKAGAAINAGAGELWNSIKNVWNGTEEEYQNFYELSKKFEPNYNKALRESGSLDVMRNNPEMFFRRFETDFKKDMGHQYNLENSVHFQQTAEQYQNAQILKQRIDILNKAMQEVRMYQSEQDALVHSPAQSEGLNPASHIVSANKLLLQYFNNDQEAVDMILNGTIGNAQATIKAITGIKEDTEKLNKAVLDGKTFDQIQNDYKSQYKAMYGTEFVPDELTEKVMDAQATGGMVKLGAITIVSILITKSPIMAEISAAAGGAEATGAAANLVRTLVAKYGQTAVQQGIKLAMTSGTLATDVGFTILGQLTDNRDGIQWNEVGESTKGSAKYIFFGAYVGAPLAQAVSKSLGKIGATSRLFEGGTKTANGAIQTTSISGDKLIQNFMKGGNKVLTKGGGLLTEIAAFAGLDVAGGEMDIAEAMKEQGSFLPKLKLMNHVLEYMLGAKTHTATSRANLDAAIEKSGVKNWNIKEIKTPEKTQYVVDVDGLPVGKFEDANQLATAMIERVTANYDETAVPEIKAEIAKPRTEGKPKSEITRPQGMNAQENIDISKKHIESNEIDLDELLNGNPINLLNNENNFDKIMQIAKEQGKEKEYIAMYRQALKDSEKIDEILEDILSKDQNLNVLYNTNKDFASRINDIVNYGYYCKFNGKTGEKITNNAEYIKSLLNDSVDKIKDDVAKDKHYEEIINNCIDNPKSEEANKLYKQYLDEEYGTDTKGTFANVRKVCEKIHSDFGVKVFLPTDTKEAGVALKLVYQELSNFKMHAQANGETVKLPEVINFSTTSLPSFIKGTASGYSQTSFSGTDFVFVKGLTIDQIKFVLRHELTHVNDKLSSNEFPSDIDVKKYAEELLNAGVDVEHISYAYVNRHEFLAVASEGDIRSYSNEFKSVLEKLGMPKFILNMQNMRLANKKVTENEKNRLNQIMGNIENEVKQYDKSNNGNFQVSTMSDAEFATQGRELCRRSDGTESPAARALLEAVKNSDLSNNSYDINHFKLDDFKKMTRDYQGNLYSEEMLSYAKEIVESIPKDKGFVVKIGDKIYDAKTFEEVVVESNDKPLTPYTKVGNKIFAIKPNVVSENSVEETVASEETNPQNPATTSFNNEIQTFAEISNDFAQNHKSYELYSDNDGNNVIMIVAVAGERSNAAAGIPFTYEVYRFDKDGNQTAEPLKGLSEKEAKKYQLENKQFIDNQVSDNSGTLNSFIIPLPKIIRDALLKENGNSRKVDAKSQPIVIPSSNNGFGLEVQKATSFLGKDKIFFNGQKVATTKKELEQQLKDAGVSDYEIKSLFKYVKERKDKQVIERLSIIFRDQKYRINDNANKYLDLAKTEEDAAILNMLITIDADSLEQSFALIKERPYLYDFLSEGADIIKKQAGSNSSTRLYAIEDIMPGIKTEHQSQAVLEVLKKLGNNDTSYLRNFINKTVSVCVKTESDIPKFAEFARKYKDGTNNHYIDITQDEETILKYWELLSDSKPGITPRALGQLSYNPEVVDYAIQLKNTGIRNELFQYLVSKGTKINLNELLADKPDMYTVLQRVAKVDRGINETLKLLNRLTQNPDGSRNQDALNLGLKLIDFDMNAIHTGNNSVEFLYAPGWSHFHNILSMCKNSDGSFNAKKMSLVNSLIDNGFIDYRLHHNSVMDDVKAILDKYSDDFDYDGFINKFIQYGIPKKTIASLLMRDLSTAKGIIETIETLYESKNYSNDNIMLAINRMLDSKEDNSTILAEQLRDPELQVWFNRKDETKRQGLSYENLSNELIEELSSKDITQEKLQKIKEKFIILGSFRDSKTADWKKYEELIQNIYGIQDPKQLIEGLKSFNYFGTNPDMITHFILKGNFDTYKEVFEFLNSKYIEEGTGRKIALGCNKESVRDIMDAFALLDEEYNITRYQDRNNKPKLAQKVWDNLIEGSQENFKATVELCKMFKGDARISIDFKTTLLSTSPENLNLIKELYTRFKNGSISIEDFQNFVKLSTDYQKSNIQDLIINMLKEGKTYSEISMEVFKTSVDKALNTPLPESYNPENAYALDSRNSQRKLEIASDKSSMQLVPLETAKKPYKLLNLPSNKELIAALDRGEPVVIDIPDEGGMKPVKGNTSIAQDDIQALGVVESAEVDLVYAVKRNWSNRKIARDIYQNSHDGHGRTLEGVQLSIKKVDGKYKVRLSGKSTYSYDFLKYMGATIKNMATDSAGKYGEGTKIVAASLLAKESTDYVRYASGDWTFEFNRSSDDVKTAEMTRKLTKNETPIDGNYIEFTTSDVDLVESMLEAKDYFEHPYNKDFQNVDFENEFFAIKILPPEEQGNIYMVQRYESYGNFENSLDAFTLVFKVKSEDVALSSKSKDAWVLPSDRDRSGLSYDDIKNMFNKYAKTMSDNDLVKLIATMEPLWNGSSRSSYLGRDIVETLAKIAEDRNLKIDFSSHHYVYASDALDKEFAKNMGYTPISIKAFTKIGLDDLSGASKAKTALKPTEVQEAKIKLLNEGARLIAQTLNPEDATKMTSEEADAPKFVFNEGGLKGEGGEAIVEAWARTYNGHWIKSTMLDMNGINCRFADVLATWLHEMTHKYGGDNSVEFTVAIKNLENHIIKVLVDNPDALAKFKYLAEKYDEVGGSSFIERTVDTDFSVESYRKEIHDEVSSLKEYKEFNEYVSSSTLQAPTRPVPEYKKLEPDMSKTYPEPLPTAEELSKQLKETGRVELSVPDLGGMKPTEDPAIIHEEDIPILGKAQKTTNTILYGQQLGWSPFKVARDIIQNFYDGNGHTMEGVTIKIERDGNKYKVRIEGKSKYDYNYLKNTGRGTKGYLVYDIGGFGEGAKVTALSLLAQGSNNVRYGSGSWTTDFHTTKTRIDTQEVDIMARTLSKADKDFDGSFMEFETSDAELVEQLLASKDFFVQPFNPGAQNLTYENKYFGFKFEENIPEKIILGQQFDISNDLKSDRYNSKPKLQLVFKLLPNNPEVMAFDNGKELKLTSTGVDRGNLDVSDAYKLCDRYVKTMSDTDIMQTLATLEEYWISENPYYTEYNRDNSLEMVFLTSIANEARSRWGYTDIFHNQKLVYINATSAEDREKAQWLKENGYRFVRQDFRYFVLDGEKEYNKQHNLHSIEPTQAEAQKLEIIRKAVLEIGQWNTSGLRLDISNTPIYVYDSEITNNPSIHARIVNKTCTGIFIDRKILETQEFTQTVQEVMAQILHYSGVDETSTYSYELTDLMRVEFSKFITDPNIVQKVHALRNLYNNAGK